MLLLPVPQRMRWESLAFTVTFDDLRMATNGEISPSVPPQSVAVKLDVR